MKTSKLRTAALDRAVVEVDTQFIQWVDGFEAGGNCPVDLVFLNDGRVVGIDGETLVLYESYEDFISYEMRERPCIPLYKESNDD